MMDQTLRVAVAQMLTVDGDFEGNVRRAGEMLREAAGKGVEVLCFPEFFLTGTGEQAGKESASLEFLTCQAREHDIDVVAGTIVETDGGAQYNTCYYVDRHGEIRGKYRKTHLFLLERQFRTPGDRLVVIDHPKAKLGLMVCWEAFFPEVARGLSQMGAEVIFCPTWVEDWEGEQGGVAERRALMRARATENQVFLVDAVSCGETVTFGQPMRLAGHSRIVSPGPLGRVMEEAGYEPRLLVADLNLAEIRQKREFFNLWGNRREDLYAAGYFTGM